MPTLFEMLVVLRTFSTTVMHCLSLILCDSRDALRSIIISQRLLGTREIAVFHHTGCGMLTFNTEQLRKIVKDSDPSNSALNVVDQFDFLEFNQLEQSIKEDVQFLKENPLVLPQTEVTGWVYEVETGKVNVYGYDGELHNADVLPIDQTSRLSVQLMQLASEMLDWSPMHLLIYSPLNVILLYFIVGEHGRQEQV